MMKSLTCGCALALGLAALPGVSVAATTTEPPRSETVRYGDLDVATADGWRTLNGRLTLAARHVCDEPTATNGDARAKTRRRACEESVMATAQRAVAERRATSIAQRNAF